MINANEIADLMGVSKATAYKIIRQLNAELKESGCRTIQGRVSREYFERAYFVSVNIVFTISTNVFSPIPPMRFHRSRHRAFTAFGYLAVATSPSSSSARSFRR